MVELPPAIRALYRIATTHDVRSWSFGQLKAVRTPNASSWQEMKGSLDDQAIFGPRHDFVCACGKYEGGRHKKHDLRSMRREGGAGKDSALTFCAH